jgi:CRISPR-associated endonuclease Csn1
MEKKEYNIGLDIGTNSVGWSVVEVDNQKVMRKGNKALWGVRLFEEANSAETRRMQRSTRRRYDRRRERLRLLQDEFKEEIIKVDKDFFQKLKESKYSIKDKLNKKIILSKEEKKELKDFQNKYKTIYHLRKELIYNPDKKDIRLVYLAIHHIIKYRGNFLYQSSNFNIDKLDIKGKLNELFSSLSSDIQELGIPNDYADLIDLDVIENDLLKETKNDVKSSLMIDLSDILNKNFATEFGKLMVGNKVNINKLLMLESDDKLEISFSGTDYEDKYNEYQNALGEKIEILDVLKQIYDCVFLKKIFKDNKETNLSSLMVKYFDQHKSDLKFLKDLFRDNRELYDKIFRTKKELCLYEKYITNNIDYDTFKKEINKLLELLFDSKYINNKQELLNEYNLVIKERIENGDFLPRITTTDNGKYPYQLNKSELIKIIENQGKYYPFLLNKVNDNKTYKIVKLLEFRIPYYVGPLVCEKRSKNAWLERTINNIKITPYNFDEVVDKEKTAEKFIKRMISHCTYLLDEYALTNNSILYSKFKVMNELKQIRVNDKKLELKFQQKILEDFFMKTPGTITDKKFKNYLIFSGEYSNYEGDLKITGYSADGKFANNMQSYIDFFGENEIFAGTDYDEENAEEIIEWITIFEDKDILEKKIRDNYNKLSENQIKKVLIKKYSGWGSLSKKLLKTKYYKDNKTELYKSILDLMYETDNNFMQIINDDKYNFQEMIQEFNNKEEYKKLSYAMVDELATSPKTKRGIYQALKVVEELVDYIGYEPKNISIEMARSDEEKVRKDSRKEYIKKLYDGCKNSIENYKKLKLELDSHEITSQRLFLYFIQEGKCLYSGTPLNIEDIENQSLYEIDHIIPRSLIKDDSVDNKALVLKKCNQDKKASYVLPSQFRNSHQKAWWKHLKDNKLMSAKKFHNLIREKYNEEDINGFINRQLVETRQITKHVANILKNLHTNSNIIYLKADLLHNYREKYDLFKFRDINDYHHAHDAYLAAVLGEYKEHFMKRKINFDMVKELNSKIVEMDEGKRRNLRFGYVINSLDENLNDIVLKISENFVDNETGEILFDAHEFNKRIENTLYRNDILISKKVEYRSGELYNQTKNKKGGSGVPLKATMPTELYGAYTSLNPAYAVLIKINKKGKISQKLVGFPIYLINKSEDTINNYYKKLLNLSDTDSFEFDKKHIPFYSIINWNNQICSLVGASDYVEVCNSIEFNFDKSFMMKHKYAIKKLYDKKYDIETYDYEHSLDEIITYIIDKMENKYQLYNNLINDLKMMVHYNNYEGFDIESKENIIKELFNLLKFNSTTANFKFLNQKYSSAFGRKKCRTIEHAIIISKSVTGIRESRYEF